MNHSGQKKPYCYHCGATVQRLQSSCPACGEDLDWSDDSPPPEREPFRLQFSLRTLLVFVLLASIGLGWLGSKIWRIRNEMQRKTPELNAVAEIRKMGGSVTLGVEELPRYHVKSRVPRSKPGTAFDRWLRSRLGASDRPYSYPANWVTLHNSGVTDADLVAVQSLPDLEFLSLDNTQITDAGLALLARLDNLLVLTLSNTQVTDSGLVHLRNLANLQILDLEGTQVTDAGLAHLKGLTSLRHLAFRNTQVTDQGVKELQQALPNCEISCF